MKIIPKDTFRASFLSDTQIRRGALDKITSHASLAKLVNRLIKEKNEDDFKDSGG